MHREHKQINIFYDSYGMFIPGCSNGTYGAGCSNNCSGHCMKYGYQCNHTDGSCPDGCYPGWEGAYCEKRTVDIKCTLQ